MNAAANRSYGTTFTKRMLDTADDIERLNKAKAPYEKKAMIIRCAKLPKALYGCEVAPANETALRTFRTSITKALAYTTKQRSADLTFATASYGPDLDPDTHIFSRRCVAFRRYVTKSTKTGKRWLTFLQHTKKQGILGRTGKEIPAAP